MNELKIFAARTTSWERNLKLYILNSSDHETKDQRKTQNTKQLSLLRLYPVYIEQRHGNHRYPATWQPCYGLCSNSVQENPMVFILNIPLSCIQARSVVVVRQWCKCIKNEKQNFKIIVVFLENCFEEESSSYNP